MADDLKIESFDEWISFIFDHPVSEPAWYWDDEASEWDEDEHPAEVVAYMTELFENSTEVLKPFSNAQLNQGLWYMASNSCSNHMFALTNQSVPWERRLRCIRAMESLFRKLFATRCSEDLSHLRRVGDPEINPLNGVCYMWFDLIPIHGKPEIEHRREIDAAFLEILENILYIPHDACREGGLLGVTEWNPYYGPRLSAAVQRFLQFTPDLNPKLVEFAERRCID